MQNLRSYYGLPSAVAHLENGAVSSFTQASQNFEVGGQIRTERGLGNRFSDGESGIVCGTASLVSTEQGESLVQECFIVSARFLQKRHRGGRRSRQCPFEQASKMPPRRLVR